MAERVLRGNLYTLFAEPCKPSDSCMTRCHLHCESPTFAKSGAMMCHVQHDSTPLCATAAGCEPVRGKARMPRIRKGRASERMLLDVGLLATPKFKSFLERMARIVRVV